MRPLGYGVISHFPSVEVEDVKTGQGKPFIIGDRFVEHALQKPTQSAV